MKQLYNILTIIALLTPTACIKEDFDDCPPPETEKGVWLEFECIEIFDAGDREIIFEKVTDQLELLLYDNTGKLIYNFHYTAEQLAAGNWKVYLSEQTVSPGIYKLLAHVNYNNEHYTVTGKETLATLISEVEHDNENKINYPLADTYYGKYDLNLTDNSGVETHKIMLSKNTNFINFTVKFQSRVPPATFKSTVTGPNSRYAWDNIAIPDPVVAYQPFRSNYSDGGKTITHFNKTMRISHGEDLKIEVNIIYPDLTSSHTLDIPELLARIDKYNTNEKLEHYDEFNFDLTLNEQDVIVNLKVNGWFLVQDGEDV